MRGFGLHWRQLRQSIHAVGWASIMYLGVYVLGMVQYFFLAKWLSPEVWAVFGLAFGFSCILNAVTAVELDQAWMVSLTKYPVKTVLATIWVSELCRRFVLLGLIWVGSPILALLWDATAWVDVLKIVAIANFIESFQSQALLQLKKQLAFRKLCLFQIGVKTGSTICAVLLAVWLGNVWALAYKYLIQAILTVLFSHLLFPYWPGLHWDPTIFKSLWRFARHIPSISLAMILMTAGSEWVIGWVTDFRVLGAWILASLLVYLPYQFLLQVISVVGLPTFSSHRLARDDQLPYSLAAPLCLIALAVLIIYAALGFFGAPLLALTLNPTWATAGELLLPLAVLGLFRCWSHLFTLVFFGLNQPFQETHIIWAEVLLSGTMLLSINSFLPFSQAVIAYSWVFVLGFCVRWAIFSKHFTIVFPRLSPETNKAI